MSIVSSYNETPKSGTRQKITGSPERSEIRVPES